MEEFLTYLDLGFHHIADPQACDHLLFVITLCAAYPSTAWRQVLLLVTAFTVGHSITLALAALQVVPAPAEVIEMLIPVTILLTSLYNVVVYRPVQEQYRAFHAGMWPRYALALGFGLIHGLGFSNFFRALMGGSTQIIWPLFSFNVGVEVGQIMIIIVFFLLLALLRSFRDFPHRDWNLFVSGIGAGGALLILAGQVG
jgi:hypothetical protein